MRRPPSSPATASPTAPGSARPGAVPLRRGQLPLREQRLGAWSTAPPPRAAAPGSPGSGAGAADHLGGGALLGPATRPRVASTPPGAEPPPSPSPTRLAGRLLGSYHVSYLDNQTGVGGWTLRPARPAPWGGHRARGLPQRPDVHGRPSRRPALRHLPEPVRDRHRRRGPPALHRPPERGPDGVAFEALGGELGDGLLPPIEFNTHAVFATLLDPGAPPRAPLPERIGRTLWSRSRPAGPSEHGLALSELPARRLVFSVEERFSYGGIGIAPDGNLLMLRAARTFGWSLMARRDVMRVRRVATALVLLAGAARLRGRRRDGRHDEAQPLGARPRRDQVRSRDGGLRLLPRPAQRRRESPRLHRPYRAYESSTLAAREPGLPLGASRISPLVPRRDHRPRRALARRGCRSPPPGGRMPAGRTNLGTDLRVHHPVSFLPGPSSDTHLPAADDAVRLDAAGRVQCTSCHDPHRDDRDPAQRKFLVKSNLASGLCLSCHARPAGRRTRQPTSRRRLRPQPGRLTAYTTSATGAPPPPSTGPAAPRRGAAYRLPRLARRPARPPRRLREALPPVAANRGGVHDAVEGRAGYPRRTAIARRHAECVDCHDPHAAAVPPAGAPSRASGIDRKGCGARPLRVEVCCATTAPTTQSGGAPETIRAPSST